MRIMFLMAITDVVCYREVDRKSDPSRPMIASSARSFPSYACSRVADNVTIQKERPLWVLNCMSADCRMLPLNRN